jgi:hypothetical protein
LDGDVRGEVHAAARFVGGVLMAGECLRYFPPPVFDENVTGFGAGRVLQPPVHVEDGQPSARCGEEQFVEESLRGAAPHVVLATVFNGGDEVSGESPRGFGVVDVGEGVPPPCLFDVGDLLRIEAESVSAAPFVGYLPEVGAAARANYGPGSFERCSGRNGGGFPTARSCDDKDSVTPTGAKLRTAPTETSEWHASFRRGRLFVEVAAEMFRSARHFTWEQRAHIIRAGE